MWTHLYEQYTVKNTAGGYAVGTRKETASITDYASREIRGYPDYTFDETTGRFASVGERQTIRVTVSSSSDYTVYTYFGTTLRGIRAVGNGEYIQLYDVVVDRVEKPAESAPGELVQSFADEAEAWPADGIRDGYWYRCVREFDHPFLMYAQKDGLRREARSACVRVPEGLRELLCGAKARTEK